MARFLDLDGAPHVDTATFCCDVGQRISAKRGVPTDIVPPMRWICAPCALVLGCGFSAPRGGAPDPDAGSDSSTGMDAAIDGTPVDGPPVKGPRVRRIDITDAQVTGGPHTDFPLLVSLTESWLRGTASGGDVASASGFDIGFFADAAGTMRLAHELELYRGETGALVAWVKVPALSPTTELFLRYGDPAIAASQEDAAAVWSNDFAAVWHLQGLGDSTANANAGTDGGSMGAGGQIADGRAFDGMNDLVALGSAASIDDVFTGGGTAEAWVRAAGWGEGSRGRILEKGDTATGETSGWYVSVDNANVSASILFGHVSTTGSRLGAWNTPASSMALNAWTHVAVVYDQGSTANDPSIYINGAAVALSETSSPGGSMASDGAGVARLGNRGAGDRTFNGRIDEMRLSRTARSAEWIATSFRDQADPGAFYTVGPEL